MVRKRSLTEEEKKLWKHVTRHDVPFIPPENLQEEIIASAEKKPIRALPTIRKKSGNKPAAKNAPAPIKPIASAPNLGVYAGVDKQLVAKFRKGNLAIDATLDLHGMTLEGAHQRFLGFITAHISAGSRCLLVITGKGTRSTSQHESGRGILRGSLPGWLDAPNVAPFILACDTAAAKHGGAGAYYILLRRRRSTDGI